MKKISCPFSVSLIILSLKVTFCHNMLYFDCGKNMNFLHEKQSCITVRDNTSFMTKNNFVPENLSLTSDRNLWEKRKNKKKVNACVGAIFNLLLVVKMSFLENSEFYAKKLKLQQRYLY